MILCFWRSRVLHDVACVVCCVEPGKGWSEPRLVLLVWSVEVGWSTTEVAKMSAELSEVELAFLTSTSFTHWNSPGSPRRLHISSVEKWSLTHCKPPNLRYWSWWSSATLPWNFCCHYCQNQSGNEGIDPSAGWGYPTTRASTLPQDFHAANSKPHKFGPFIFLWRKWIL